VTWCRERHIAVVMIDHTNKATAPNGGKPKAGLGRVYGSMAKAALTDFAVEFDGDINSAEGIHATWTKTRDEPPANYDVLLVEDKVAGALAFNIVPLIKDGDLPEHELAVLRRLEQEQGAPYTVAELEKETGLPKWTVQRALKALVAKQRVLKEEHRSGGGRTVQYRVPVLDDDAVIGKVVRLHDPARAPKQQVGDAY
jgi:hypothetical protein